MFKLLRNRKGQGLVEYALIIAGVTLICAVGISVFGHKVSDMINAVAVILPGAHDADNGPIVSGQIIETTPGTKGTPIVVDLPTILNNSGAARLSDNMEGGKTTEGMDGLVVDAGANTGS